VYTIVCEVAPSSWTTVATVLVHVTVDVEPLSAFVSTAVLAPDEIAHVPNVLSL